MGKYLHLFENENAFQTAYNGEDYLEPWVSYTEDQTVSAHVDYNKVINYFTIEALGSGVITWDLSGLTVGYSKNGGEWTEMNSATSISVSQGDIINFSGDNETYGFAYYDPDWEDNVTAGTIIHSTARFNVYGDVMTLLGDGWENAQYHFCQLFNGNTNLVSAENLILPSELMSSNCYDGMFSGCTSLTGAPDLPVMTLSAYCYKNMFAGCTSLTTAPNLPATTLDAGCYENMFYSCSTLVNIPSILPAMSVPWHAYHSMFAYTAVEATPTLPATTLGYACYAYMFMYCESLTAVTALPAMNLENSCYAFMFNHCTSLVHAQSELPATALTTTCYGNMFSYCNNLETTPVLPAATLVDHCYQYMFKECPKVNYIKALYVTDNTSSATRGTSYWVEGVAATGTFVKHTNATWTTTGVNGVPTGWTVERASS